MRSKGEPSLSDAEKQGEDDSTATVQDATKVCMFFLIGSKWVTKMNFTFWGATEGIPRGSSREKKFLLRVCGGTWFTCSFHFAFIISINYFLNILTNFICDFGLRSSKASAEIMASVLNSSVSSSF